VVVGVVAERRDVDRKLATQAATRDTSRSAWKAALLEEGRHAREGEGEGGEGGNNSVRLDRATGCALVARADRRSRAPAAMAAIIYTPAARWAS
jgi:hypothetical protein